jgi:hypothetical protein
MDLKDTLELASLPPTAARLLICFRTVGRGNKGLRRVLFGPPLTGFCQAPVPDAVSFVLPILEHQIQLPKTCLWLLGLETLGFILSLLIVQTLH